METDVLSASCVCTGICCFSILAVIAFDREIKEVFWLKNNILSFKTKKNVIFAFQTIMIIEKMECMQVKVNNETFKFSSKKEAKFLLGAYRSDKNQLAWILGEQPRRYQKIYNVRLNDSLFSQRNGGITNVSKPDYILLYDYQVIDKGYHLFKCVSSAVRTEEEMRSLEYPDPQGDYMTYLLGDEIQTEPLNMEDLVKETHECESCKVPFSPVFITGKDIVPKVDYKKEQPLMAKITQERTLRFIDLFAGIGGIRCGLEQAARDAGLNPICVFTSEIKPYAVKVLKENHPTETITGDITKVDTSDIPDFDVLCAGFPCQAFSSAGKRQGFADTRGTMFFQVERILRDKKPQGFILENVEGLVNHDGGRPLNLAA